MPVQLPLHIGLRDSATFTNFYPADNAQVLAQCQQCARFEGERFVFMHGVTGSGKSHLLQAACHAASERGQPVVYLPLAQRAGFSTTMLEGLEDMGLLCIDDLDSIAGDAEWEEAIFHLYNRVRDAEARLIVAANNHPTALAVQLPDLQSRLVWGLVFKLQSLDDEPLTAALQLRARGRGLELPAEVIAYLLKRCTRDMHSLFDLLEKLDRESLVAQRKLTIPFVRQFVD
ncbi:DnaA regulatory inactivator Hda [Sulfuriflexus sp.]|uniref:DnaA regulatory inactivator Hda n=1 Tax=Sulfuriflexus sp. TaxID=2015443 RepID=UPI0028CC2838|nr:DnaA regulatory inactivator Hda [Sulfuriflexus sp.]MDT8404642.1 DnaA regulatory inactivator Hda [Sulfuriflexus sp.]